MGNPTFQEKKGTKKTVKKTPFVRMSLDYSKKSFKRLLLEGWRNFLNAFASI